MALLLKVLTIAFFTVCLPSVCLARAGGGCLARGTEVATPSGPRTVESIEVGDQVLSFGGSGIRLAEVVGRRIFESQEILELITARGSLKLTPTHQVMVRKGEFLDAGRILPGRRILALEGGILRGYRVRSVRIHKGVGPVYDLVVWPGATFFAGSVAVHNKGCFLPDTPVLTSEGKEVMISHVKQGDELLAFDPAGSLASVSVLEVVKKEADHYALVQTQATTLRVTLDHPFFVGRGRFRTLARLNPGDAIWAWDGSRWSSQKIISIEVKKGPVEVFHLMTTAPHTFFVGRIGVHNKGGGCFPKGTLVSTPRGWVPIETLSPGQEVWAVTPQEKLTPTRVEGLALARGTLLEVKVGGRVVGMTQEHPVALETGGFVEAGRVKEGQRVLVLGGEGVRGAPVDQIRWQNRKETLVLNLSVGAPHTFIAQGIVVHNKGGGFRGGGSTSSRTSPGQYKGGSSEGWIPFVALLLLVSCVFIAVMIMRAKKRSKSENLDYLYSRRDIERKANKTRRLLEFLARQDQEMDPKGLEEMVGRTFRALQECWEKRAYEPMGGLLMPHLYRQHVAQLRSMERNHEINRIEDLRIVKVDIVHVHYLEKKEGSFFIALITASARDYYVDDRTGRFLRGDKTTSRFQEFLTFQRHEGKWLLRDIEQAGESDVLKDENFVEAFTQDTLRRIYGEEGKEGEPGPWLETKEAAKATRIERLLNFLVQTDPIWDRTKMLERVREVFTEVYLAREAGNPALLKDDDLFPDIASALKEQMIMWAEQGLSLELRNFCVRKVELVLVRNFNDPSRDEFTARIDAHAQKIVRKRERITSKDPYVMPFEEYWTFGRWGGTWKLKEVLPPAKGRRLVAEENIDEESTPGQLEWYYRQERAL